MSTGAEFVDFGSEKRLLGRADFDERLLGHLRTLVHESYGRAYRTGAVFDTAIGLAADGADKFQLTGASDATDGLGHELNAATGAFDSVVQFQNTNAIVYQIALHYAEVPSGIQVNPRTGLPEYIGILEQVGESADPDSVVDNGADMTFVVDGVTEAGVSNAGRTVRVFRKVPGRNATIMLVAVEDVTVVWTGGQNQITTSGDLGQDVISTTASDYTVVLLGPTVKRNTALLGVDGYTFIGKVTGAGAGNPPTTFDITDQDVITASLSDLQDITSRNATTDRLKVDVKSYTGDIDDPQIAVRDPGGSVVYSVDGNGNVVIEGTTTQQNFVQVNASETITDNLTAGDATDDSHLITGTWEHQPAGGGTPYFKVDGTTGHVGIGQSVDVGYQLAVSGDVVINGKERISSSAPHLEYRETDVGVDVGGLWRSFVSGGDLYTQENTAAGGDWSTSQNWLQTDRANARWKVGSNIDWCPAGDGNADLGAAALEWRDLYVDRTAYIDELSLGTAAGEGVGSDMVPDANDSRTLGSPSYQFANAHSRKLTLDSTAGYGVDSDLNPVADNTRSLGSVSRRWANLYTVNLSFAGDFLPSVDNTQDIGSASLRWTEGRFMEGYFYDFVRAGSASDSGSYPGTTLQSYRWTDNPINTGATAYHQATGVYSFYYGTINTANVAGMYVRNYGTVNTGSGSSWYGIVSHVRPATASGQSISKVYGIVSKVGFTDAVNTVVGDSYNLYCQQGLASVSSLTNQHGLYVESMTLGSNNYAIYTNLGEVRLGDSLNAVGGSFDFLPTTNDTYDLGSTSTRWAEIYGGNVSNIISTTPDPALDIQRSFAYTAGGAHYMFKLGARWTGSYNVAKMGLRIEAESQDLTNSTTGLYVEGAHSTASSSQIVKGAQLVAWSDQSVPSTITGAYCSGSLNVSGSAGAVYGLEAYANLTNTATITTRLCGIRQIFSGNTAGTVPEVVGIRVEAISHVNPTNSYGLWIGNVTNATNNYAIYTNTGEVRFGGPANLAGNVKSNVTPTTTNTYFVGSSSARWLRGYFGNDISDSVGIDVGGGTVVGIPCIWTRSRWSNTADADEYGIFNGTMNISNPVSSWAGTALKRAVSAEVTANHNTVVNYCPVVVYSAHPYHTGTGTTRYLAGYETHCTVNASGGVTYQYGFWARNATLTAGTLSVQYGLKVENMTAAVTNYAIYTGLGQVVHGDIVRPTVNDSIDLGTASLLWQRVFHRKPWAWIYSTTTQVTTATWAYVTGGNNSAGDNATINPANFQITIVETGVYRVDYFMPVGLYGTSNDVVQVAVTKNGTIQPNSYGRCGVHASVGKNAANGSCLVSCTVGDVIRLQIQERTNIDGVPLAFSTMGDTLANSVSRRWMSIELVRYL